MRTEVGGVAMLFSVRCLLLGHDDWLVRSPERIRLQCDHCRRETTGWSLNQINASRTPLSVTGSSKIRGWIRGWSRQEMSDTRRVRAADRPLIAAQIMAAQTPR